MPVRVPDPRGTKAFVGMLVVFLVGMLVRMLDGGVLGIAANGKKGSPLAEAIVQFCLVSLSIAMLVVAVLVLLGLKRNTNQAN